jgi:polyhydroxyalkanoate synthase subunit PhaC
MFLPMSWITLLLAIGAIIALWELVWKAYYRFETSHDEIHFIQTRDGWRLALSRYLPHKRPDKNRLPILLCPGLSSTRFTFDLGESFSLARHLSEAGYDVWVMELRGHGFSEKPGFFRGKSFGWNFDDHILEDAPAALHHVLKTTRSKKVHWIGHSVGGILGFAYLSQTPQAPIASLTAVASSLDYSCGPCDFRELSRLLPLARIFPFVPFGWMSRTIAPFLARFHGLFEKLYAWPENMLPFAFRTLAANNFVTISSPVLEQLATALKEGGLVSQDGKIRYFEDLKNIKTPVLAIAGDQDRQCGSVAVQQTLDSVGSEVKELAIFGPKQGHQSHYGHFDLLVGKKSKDEVFPKILSWVEKHESS